MSRREIEEVFHAIADDVVLTEDFARKETIEEMYEFCQEVSGGYSFEEFEEFVDEMFEYAGGEVLDEYLDAAGGKKVVKDKVLAGLLGTLMSVSGVGAIDGEAVGTNTGTRKVKDFVVGIKNKAIERFRSLKGLVKRHHGAAIGSVSAVAAGAATLVGYIVFRGKRANAPAVVPGANVGSSPTEQNEVSQGEGEQVVARMDEATKNRFQEYLNIFRWMFEKHGKSSDVRTAFRNGLSKNIPSNFSSLSISEKEQYIGKARAAAYRIISQASKVITFDVDEIEAMGLEEYEILNAIVSIYKEDREDLEAGRNREACRTMLVGEKPLQDIVREMGDKAIAKSQKK
jgi:hypothetical protein